MKSCFLYPLLWSYAALAPALEQPLTSKLGTHGRVLDESGVGFNKTNLNSTKILAIVGKRFALFVDERLAVRGEEDHKNYFVIDQCALRNRPPPTLAAIMIGP
jgi:hypothetical protein